MTTIDSSSSSESPPSLDSPPHVASAAPPAPVTEADLPLLDETGEHEDTKPEHPSFCPATPVPPS